MSRSGYSDDYEYCGLWRAAVDRAARGARGQHFLRKLREALDAMPEKRLIAGAFSDEHGAVCALGSLDPRPRHPSGRIVDPEDPEEVGQHFGIARALAAEIVYENDEGEWRRSETPEARWIRMRDWVERQIQPEESEG